MTTRDILPNSVRAHELYGDFWFNSEPVPISALRGRVILIHFWDYTCIHCLRAIPYIQEWARKYEPYGLVVVGVHTPKFPFGKDPAKIQKVINRLGIGYPVVMDNEYLIASRYESRSWPATYLIDKNGYIRLQNVGKGNYASTEHAIQALLHDAGVSEELPLPMEALRDEDKPGAVCYRVTPDLFSGYIKGTLGNVEGYSPESVVKYLDPTIYIEGRLYAAGSWMNDKNSLRLDANTGEQGHIIVSYQALEANAVIKPEGETGCEVEVQQDEAFLTDANKGDDVLISPGGRSYLVIDESRMYNLVKNREYGNHLLRLTTSSNGFALYSLTFVSCAIPELISNN